MTVAISKSKARTNRSRPSRARALGGAVGRIVGFPPVAERERVPMTIPPFASSWPRLAI